MQNSLQRNAIKYVGISKLVKNYYSNFKVFSISHSINLHSVLPIIKDIVQVSCNINIISCKVVQTPKGTSFDGHRLTGTKVFFKGILNCDVQYYSDDESKGLHFHKFSIIFVESTELSSGYCAQSNLVSAFANITDISVLKIDNEKIYLTMVCNVSTNF